MKYLPLIALLALPIQASEMCNGMAELSKVVMQNRQHEVSLRKTLDAIEALSGDEQTKKAIKAMVIMAYERPAFQTEENQAREVAEFENIVYKICIQNYKAEDL